MKKDTRVGERRAAITMNTAERVAELFGPDLSLLPTAQDSPAVYHTYFNALEHVFEAFLRYAAVPRIPSRHMARGDSDPQSARREKGFARQREYDPWRTLEVNTHSPGLVGNLVGKRAYRHTDNDATPNATYDYVYVYDAVGNLYLVLNDEGGEEYPFSQDAWGNELSIGSFYGTAWSSARTYGVSDHQTGKWIDPFTGLYFFHHRWYESGVGRWVSREPLLAEASYALATVGDPDRRGQYVFCANTPTSLVDSDGRIWAPWQVRCAFGALLNLLRGAGPGVKNKICSMAAGCAGGVLGGWMIGKIIGTGVFRGIIGIGVGGPNSHQCHGVVATTMCMRTK